VPRSSRIDLPGIPQHVVERGVDRQPCFFTDIDRTAKGSGSFARIIYLGEDVRFNRVRRWVMGFFRVSKAVSERLVKQHESGIGYQIARYRREREPLIVFNASIAMPLDEFRNHRFSSDDYLMLSDEFAEVGIHEKFDLNDELAVVFSQFGGSSDVDSFGLSFTSNPISPPEAAMPTGVPTSYYRYCAFSRDRRVSAKGDFVAGTYATTYSDMHFVPSGFAAVGRYALPNPASARYISTIVTLDRPSLMGTASPNFGQAGGGVEVLFDQQASHVPGASFPVEVG
jgi:hypothetical protein